MSAIAEMAAVSDRGLRRSLNEDCVCARPEAGLAVIADGMGGHNAGEVASHMAVELIADGIEAVVAAAGALDARRAESLIAEHVGRANAQVYASGRARAEHAGMGTTVVVALWHGAGLSVGHVGDSRLYRLRAGMLEQLTRDHSLVQQHVDRGTLTRESARSASIRSILTRAVGSEPRVSVEMNTYETEHDDLYLLCTDGLTEMLTDEQIAETLTVPGRANQDAAAELVRKANELGGVDNISVVLARVKAPGRAR